MVVNNSQEKYKQLKKTINLVHSFFYKDQQNFFEAGMSLAYFQIKAQMFLKCP